MSEELDTPRIYVACLAAYNNGRLHGKWIDAAQELDDIRIELNAMLAASPEPDAEEWAIHDYDNFEGLSLCEYEGIERVHDIALFIEEHGKLGSALLEYYGSNFDDATRALDNYLGCYTSLADYAQALTEETSEVPKHLEHYINYEAMGRDMNLNGDLISIETRFDEVHLFVNA
jgi:antirestriction protein